MKERFFEVAKAMSKHSGHDTHKMGAVIVKKNRRISTGYNKLKTHPRSLHPQSMIHAELDCILGCSKEDLLGADLYIYRQHKDGKVANAKPCIYCSKLIEQTGIKNIYYTN